MNLKQHILYNSYNGQNDGEVTEFKPNMSIKHFKYSYTTQSEEYKHTPADVLMFGL